MYNVRIYPTTDLTLPVFSHSILTAYNTCPTWGFVRYGLHKTFESSARAMALEAGSAMHRVFSALRLYSLREKGLNRHFEVHTQRIFGAEAEVILSKLRTSEDHWINSTSFALEALHTSGYYDDPYDKRRTLANLEEAGLAYAKSMYSRQAPVWVQDVDNPNSLVGIELPFDYTIEFEYEGVIRCVRYIGTIDAIHQDDKGVYIEENKTASRLDDSWATSFEVNNQVTGYTIFGSAMIGLPINRAIIRGVRIPQPRRGSGHDDGVRTEYTTREDDERTKFFDWVLYSFGMYDDIQGDVEQAARFTHSCNRYFRPCSLVPFCKTFSKEERADVLDTMVVTPLSPSEQAIAEKSFD